jgi:DNA repair exonuclease SbcCD nuclease subunit
MVEMPDHGELKKEHFGHYDKVFSGHFHLRQVKNNINYIGNAFPHNFSDAGDADRGCMILDWDGEPEYIAWPDQPLYKVLDLSTVIDNAADILKPKMHVRVNLDIDISYEEANFIKEKFVSDYNLREMALIPNKRGALEDNISPGELKFESVDQIVTDQITNIDSEFYDNKMLLEIYRSL